MDEACLPSELPLILGIDPGSQVAGFAFIRAKKAQPFHAKDFSLVDAGILKISQSMSHPERIGHLHDALYELVRDRRPAIAVLEKAFYGVNASSSLKLGEARGAFISALQRCKIGVAEITPAQVKKVIAGNGRADKEAISLVVEATLGFSRGKLPYDVTDAIAIALSFSLGQANLLR